MKLEIKAKKDKYRHTQYLLPFYRRDYFAVLSTLALILAGFFILPKTGVAAASFKELRLTIFSLLILAWGVNLLADKLRPLWVHILVAVAGCAAYVVGLFIFIGVGVSDLRYIFFNFSVMEGMWGLMLEGPDEHDNARGDFSCLRHTDRTRRGGIEIAKEQDPGYFP